MEVNQAKPIGSLLGRVLGRGLSRGASRGVSSSRGLLNFGRYGSSFGSTSKRRRLLKGIGSIAGTILGTSLIGYGVDQFLGSRSTSQDYGDYGYVG